MSKYRYRYNCETFAYERVHFDAPKFAKRAGVAVVLGMLLGTTFLLYCFVNGWHYEDVLLSQYNKSLEKQIAQQTQTFAQIQNNLNRLHKMDNSYYRSILNMDKIDASIWDGGVGGTDKYSALSPEVLKTPAILADKLAYQSQLQVSSFTALEKIAEEKTDELKHIPAIRPVPGHVVSGFGYRRAPYHTHLQYHPALDFDADTGTPIKATGNGVVIAAGVTESGYGIQVVLDHGFGYKTRYAHMSRTEVKLGQQIKRGDLLGYSGNTGYSTGPHLHYEVIKHGEQVDPFHYFYSN
jgi:murein DD-endopeptidase MepM/ murein hydrolase activator NlpD